MRIAVVAGFAPSLLNFRRELLLELVRRDHEVVAMAPEVDRDVTRELAAMHIAYRPISMIRNQISLAADSKTVLSLARLFDKSGIDVCFNYTIKPVVYGSVAASLVGVPRIVSMVTGLGYLFTNAETFKRKLVQRIAEQLYREALRRCDGVVFQNNDDKAFFADRNLLTGNLAVTIVNGSGVDVSRFTPHPMPAGPPHYLLIARLLREKGIREFGDAARLVRAEIPNATFEVVGPPDESPGGLSPSEREAVAANGVVLSGPASDVREALRRCSCFVLPSYREGTPRTVLEAMAMQRPIVTTDVPGCRQTTVDGKTGILVPPQNAPALAEAMVKIGRDRVFAERLAVAGRKRVEAIYDATMVARATTAAIVGEQVAIDEQHTP